MNFSLDLDKQPLILAGPILRRCQPEDVTVFVALQKRQFVTLRVYKDDEETQEVLIGTRETVALGANLHVVAVTAKVQPPALSLDWGGTYHYNLFFSRGPDPTVGEHLPKSANNLTSKGILLVTDPAQEPLDLTALSRLTYDSFRLPSFTLPPDDLDQLRVIHASCRKPHGEGKDMMGKLDELIEDSITTPTNPTPAEPRPHQLFLTGDQIYADDVADQLLWMLHGASKELLIKKIPEIGADIPNPDRWEKEESITVCTEWDENNKFKVCKTEKVVEDFWETYGSNKREELLEKHGFTAGIVSGSHLILLGEFYAMYLFIWSDRLWPGAVLNSEFELESAFRVVFPDEPLKKEVSRTRAHSGTIIDEVDSPLFLKFKSNQKQLQKFKDTLPQVRRALANIPTYMIFDDHDVTDDWYLNYEWCINVLGNPFGKRVIQNAMMAYSIFQAWGNTPRLSHKNFTCLSIDSRLSTESDKFSIAA